VFDAYRLLWGLSARHIRQRYRVRRAILAGAHMPVSPLGKEAARIAGCFPPVLPGLKRERDLERQRSRTAIDDLEHCRGAGDGRFFNQVFL
jgi:hypothetical protein